MAKRRMFNAEIVENDVFLDMPLTSQSLYFHLGMHADDDGFVSPKKIMRMIGAGEDDLNILIAKRYILAFYSGVVVIKHWPLQNTVRKDRHIPTTNKEELADLTLNEWGAYTLKKGTQTMLLEETHAPTPLRHDGVSKNTTSNSGENVCNDENGNQPLPQYSIGKVSIVANAKQLDISATNNLNSPTKKERVPTETLTEMMQEWEDVVGMSVDDIANRKACATLFRDLGRDKLSQLIRGVALAMDDRYAPRISDFVSLKRKKNDLIVWGKKNNNWSTVEVIS